jgi:hypothetical protein
MPAPAATPPLRVTRSAALAADIADVVLARVEDDDPDVRDGAWRDPVADREWLRSELVRRSELAERGAAPSPEDLRRSADYFRAAARRAAPLPVVQRFLRASVAHALTELWARAEPEDVTALLRLSRWIADHNGAVERLLVRVYCEQLDPGRTEADRREARAGRLLAGIDDEAGAATARGWLVVVLDGAAAARAVDVRDALAATVEGQRHLLVPVDPTRPREVVWRAVSTWVAGLDGARAAGAFSDAAAGIPEAAASARRLLRAAAAVALPGGLVGPQDLALETLLSAQPVASGALAELLDGVAADERLLETLSVFYAHDLDRTRTASALFLSRGGLSLRLDRIAHLTGLDPRSTRGIQVLGAALAARALREAG